MEFSQAFFRIPDYSCNPSIIGNKMVCIVLLDILQIILHMECLLVNQALLVGTWMHKIGVTSNCD